MVCSPEHRLALRRSVSAKELSGEEFVACDVVGAGRGSRVIWIGGKEAALALDNKDVPVDASCVAILERHGGR